MSFRAKPAPDSIRGGIFHFIKRKIATLALAMTLLFIPLLAHAFDIPSKPDNYINDYISLLDPNDKVYLNALLADYEIKTSNQIFIGIFNSLEGEVLEDLSMRIAEAWRAGQLKKDNGVLLLIFLNDRQLRIEVGYGLEGVLTDAKSKSIIEQILVPRFRTQQFGLGLKEAVATMMKTIGNEFSNEFTENYGQNLSKLKKRQKPIWVPFFGLLLFLIIMANSRHGRRGITFGGTSGSGFGGFGGFGGGGGGGFGGGGASGRW